MPKTNKYHGFTKDATILSLLIVVVVFVVVFVVVVDRQTYEPTLL